MKEQNCQSMMWKELQDFVKQVEGENKAKAGSARPYIDQIKSILTRQNHPVDE